MTITINLKACLPFKMDIALVLGGLGLSACIILLLPHVAPIALWARVVITIVIVLVCLSVILLRPRYVATVLGFPDALSQTIESSLPHDALTLYQQGLRPSLDNCFRYCQGRGAAEEFSTAVAKHIAQRLDVLKKSGALYECLEARHKDHALMTLIIFVTVIEAMTPFVPTKVFDQPVPPYRTIFPMLNMELASRQLFRESYRLYEISSLLNAQYSTLLFNQDTQAILQTTLSPLSASERSESDKTIESTQKKPTRLKSATTTPNEQANSNDGRDEQGADMATSQPIGEGDDGNKPTTPRLDTDVAEAIVKFLPWLEKQVQRYPINETGKFYGQREMRCLWMTESAMQEYVQAIGVPPQAFITALQAQGVLGSQSYYYVDDTKTVPLLVIPNLSFTLPMVKAIPGRIKEGNYEDDV